VKAYMLLITIYSPNRNIKPISPLGLLNNSRLMLELSFTFTIHHLTFISFIIIPQNNSYTYTHRWHLLIPYIYSSFWNMACQNDAGIETGSHSCFSLQ
jgi:hypothetical protein